jgi:CubicO group peptidase (beta-lactamase class C family)
MRRPIVVLLGCLSFTAHAGLPTDSEIHRIAEERVQAIAGPEGGMGIVIGVLDEQGPRVIAYGERDAADRRALDGDTVFEIASVSKVFTALLLEDMVRARQLALTDPAAKYLPKGTKLPERNGRRIALVDLATHTAGLPFMPDNLPALLDSAQARYSKAQLYTFVGAVTPSQDIGTEWAYSNLDYWLLQEVIAARGRASFEQLMRKRVTEPLGLHSTAVTLTPDLRARAAIGHDAVLEPAPLISSLPVFELMPAAGGVLSNQTTGAGGIARHLLQPDVPLGQPERARRTEIALDAAALASYVGRYQMQGDGVVVITRDGALLSIELPSDWGVPKLHLHAENQRQFFVKELPLQATFEIDASGRITGMEVRPPRGQKTIPAVRL